jgi:hypothetical protein
MFMRPRDGRPRAAALTFLLLLAAPGLLVAGDASEAPARAELTKLLETFLAGASKNDAAAHERFWADELIYTASSGKRTNKAEILREVKSAPAPKPTDPVTTYTAEEVRVQQYGDAAIVAFRLVGTTRKDGKTEVAYYLNTGTFVRRNGEWRAVGWQATKVPPASDTPPSKK